MRLFGFFSTATVAGLAMAFAQRREMRVAISFIGEGGSSLGEWHEAINACASRKLPAIFCVQNKSYAEIGTRRAKYLDSKDGSPKKMFKWAGQMVYWIWFCKIHSGNMGALTPEEELARREEQEEEERRIAAGGKPKRRKKSKYAFTAAPEEYQGIAGPHYHVDIMTAKKEAEEKAALEQTDNPAADLDDKD